VKRALKSVEVAVQKRRVVIINRPFVSPLEAAALCDVSTRTIYRWLESGTIHFSETLGKGLVICLNSLAATNISLTARHSESNSRIKR